MSKEVVAPGFWKKALKSTNGVTAAGLGSGAAFLLDARLDWFPYTEPLIAIAPGAALGIGILGIGKVASRYAVTRFRIFRGRRFEKQLREAGRPKLAGDLSRLLTARKLGQISLNEFESRLEEIVQKYLKST